MGHHVSRENQSVVAYSRDELTRIMITVHRMIREVKSLIFKPDASRAERISDALQEPTDSEEHKDRQTIPCAA